MQNYPYMQMVGQGPYLGYPPAPQYAPQPSPPQTQSNVDCVQVAGYEAAKAQQVEPGKTCWMRDTSHKKHPKIKKSIENNNHP